MAYHIARNNQQLGVFEEMEVRQKWGAGEFQSSDLCWTEGMAEWKPLGEAGLTPLEAEVEMNPYAPPLVETRREVEAGGMASLATLGQRLAAAILDGLTFLVVYVPLILAFGVDAINAQAAGGAEVELPPPNMGMLGLAGVLFVVLLGINLVWLATRGQTIGKRVMAIRIVALESDANPGWVKTIVLRSVVNGIIGAVPLLGMFYALADILFIFGTERRCIHDLIAGTRVVQGQPQ
jgi:uncharacterized RDD family membrane protein YckC